MRVVTLRAESEPEPEERAGLELLPSCLRQRVTAKCKYRPRTGSAKIYDAASRWRRRTVTAPPPSKPYHTNLASPVEIFVSLASIV